MKRGPKHKEDAFEQRLVKSRDRVLTAWACASMLRPDLSPQGKERLAERFLKVADAQDDNLGITPAQTQEIMLDHIQCIKANCPLLIFAEPLSRALNKFLGGDTCAEYATEACILQALL